MNCFIILFIKNDGLYLAIICVEFNVIIHVVIVILYKIKSFNMMY